MCTKKPLHVDTIRSLVKFGSFFEILDASLAKSSSLD